MIALRRLKAATRTDFRHQVRNQLYPISILVSVTAAVVLASFAPAEHADKWMPTALLLSAGGSTLLYVLGMFLIERADGVLDALAVSSLTPIEYLSAKVITLGLIGTLESVLFAVGSLGGRALLGDLGPLPNPLIFMAGAVALAALHVEVGLILAVRHHRITEALLPVSLVSLVAQVPALYVLDVWRAPLLLLIPSAPPTLLLAGSIRSLGPAEAIWAAVGTALALVGFGLWATWAFRRFVVKELKA